LLKLEVIPASVQDRDAAADVVARTRQRFPSIRHVFADAGYVSRKLDAAMAEQSVTLEIIKRSDGGGFKVVRRRWVIERTFSWPRRNRRLTAHYEGLARIAEGFATLAMIAIMLRRLTEPAPCAA
jgi:putative transposase